MTWELYLRLSVLMFLEAGAWGAWASLLAARLLGPLRFTGKQVGWIYATLPIACMIAPPVAGHLADKYFNAEWILAATHLLGAALMLFIATQRRFSVLFVGMFAYSLCYAASLPLANSVIFAQVAKAVADPVQQDAVVGKIFFWNPCAWVVVGWLLTAWRQWRGAGEERDCLIISGLLSAVLGFWCLGLPATPPAQSAETLAAALSMLQEPNFLFFLLISLVVFGAVQFCFMGFARYFEDIGIPSKYVPAALTVAPVTQTIATAFIMSIVFNAVGFRWTMVLGAACWMLLFLIYMRKSPRWIAVAAQPLHALGCMFFIIVGQIYAGKVTPPQIASSVQALVFMATVGCGFFFGSQLAGAAMDRFTVDGKFQWRKIWAVPCAVLLATIVALSLSNLKEPHTQNSATVLVDLVRQESASPGSPH